MQESKKNLGECIREAIQITSTTCALDPKHLWGSFGSSLGGSFGVLGRLSRKRLLGDS